MPTLKNAEREKSVALFLRDALLPDLKNGRAQN
jgi:hypothetical protein